MKLFTFLFLITITILNADIENGKDVYAQNCAICHRTDMTGGMGKDFNLVSYSRRKEDIVKYVTDPSKMFRKFGYGANAMPKLPLNEQEIKDVSEFIDALQPFKEWMK